MVNNALMLENRRGIMDHKWKQERQGKTSINSRPWVGMPSAKPIQQPPQQQQPSAQFQQRPQATMQSYQTPQRWFIQCPNVSQTAAPESQNVQRQQTV
jgi:hypothetical protein